MVNSISLFNVAVTTDLHPKPFSSINSRSMPLGYIVEPEACTIETLEYFMNQRADFNSTFYKEWDDVTSKTRYELLIDQIRHYASTYGTDFEGKAWVPNDGERPLFNYSEYKVIKAVTLPELLIRCEELANSGIALSTEVVNFIVDTFCQCHPEDCREEDILAFPNKELRAQLFSAYDIIPVEPFDILRYIAVKATGSGMVIQNKETFAKCKGKFDFSKLDEKRLIALSSIFLRYKNFILAFKDKGRETENNHAINRLCRLAKTHHKPLTPGFWETVLSVQPSMKECEKHFDSLTPWKAVRLIQACDERMQMPEQYGYLIRNQKLYVKKAGEIKGPWFILSLEAHLRAYLTQKLDGKKIRLPKDFRLAVPSSEKSFIGNLPLGTQFRLPTDDGFLGIYWRNEWGTHDFDLHYYDTNAHHIGWNSDFANQDNTITYSGDMTNADPEACEIMKFGKACPEGFVVCNRFNGIEGSRFDLIFGSIDQVPLKAMIDPSKIAYRAELVSESKENTLGYVCDNTFTLMSFRSGDSRVPRSSELVKIMKQKSQSFVYLDELIFPVPDDYEGEDLIDLSGDLSKDDIIKLFA